MQEEFTCAEARPYEDMHTQTPDCPCRKTKHDDDVGLKARAKTHAAVRPTHVPSWEEMISVEIDDAKAENEGDLIITYPRKQ